MKIALILAFLLCIYAPWSLRSHSAVAQSILTIDASSFADTIENDMLTLISFQAPWCGHCTNFAPELAIAAKKVHEEKINVSPVA